MEAKIIILTLAALASIQIASGQFDPHFTGNRSVMVHLFEWRWNDVAEECERFLGPYGYGGVQVSPANENIVLGTRPWYERYQPVSYKLETRSGTEQEFQSMVRRCNAVGVRIYVDVVLNHMTGTDRNRGEGTDGTPYDGDALNYPGVPYTSVDFNGPDKWKRADKDTDKLTILSMIRDRKDVLFAKFSNDIENQKKEKSWQDVLLKAQSIGMCNSTRDWKFVRDKMYGVWKSRTLAPGLIDDYQDPEQMRNCKLLALKDLDQSREYVREKLVEFLNRMIRYGVAGFRVDAAKHMWPQDLKVIYERLENLPTNQGFPSGARAFIFQEVIDYGTDPIRASDYSGIGRVTEFYASAQIPDVIRKNNQQLRYLRNWGEGWGFLPDGEAVVFVDNHDNQRTEGSGALTFKESRMYKIATEFFLAWPYGVTRVMSSFYFDNSGSSPPHDDNWNTLPVTVNPDLTCGNGWVCEHRWRPIYNMARFRNAVKGTGVVGWWDNGGNQIAFSRGNRGFIVINNENFVLDRSFNTGLPGGIYCDVITGSVEGGTCTGRFIPVANDGSAQFYISNNEEDPVIAIHVDAKL